ncbi:MAG: Capsular polysaccharide biosynthesisexport periplasmic protein WcbA Capsular polysaccharide export [Verrucomicrobiaceae bacterium]|nr:Capsular polysaccharide biosynthesisexport periplasmic protein WcbA Capsular polysaccharide export [Verrucomicrobiaceae bacterium]
MNLRRYTCASFSLLGICLALASCHSTNPDTADLPMPARQAPVSVAPRTTLAPGDTIEVFVMEDEKFAGTYKVRENGDIIMPRVGRVRVGGLSVSGAQDAVKAVLEASQLAHPTVIVDRVGTTGNQTFEDKSKMLIYVAGSVARAGQHMIAQVGTQPVMAYEALLIAGGTTPYADETHAFILRRGNGNSRTQIPLNLRSIRQGKGPDVPLQEGDLITVPERRFGLNF